MHQPTPPKILVRRKDALGDVLLASAVLPVISKRYPNHEIHFETSCKNILLNNSLIKKIVSPDTVLLQDYNQIFDLNNTYEMKPQLSILESYAKVIGCSEAELIVKFNISENENVMADSILHENHIENKYLIAIQSGASFWLKNMSPGFISNIICELKKDYLVAFVLLGSLNDPLIEGAIDLRGKCSIIESISVLKKCTAFIGHDSALIHFAKAFQIPVVGFFGNTDPFRRIAVGKSDCIITSTISCRFCYHKRKPPVIVSFCKMQSLFWRLIDSIIQHALLLLSRRNNKYVRFIINKLYTFQDKNRNGKKIAQCMENIETQDVFSRISSWFQKLEISKIPRIPD